MEVSLRRKWEFYGAQKSIEIICGDMCRLQERCDIVVCSAFRGSYHLTPGTVIRSLFVDKGIQVEFHSKQPELDLRTMGCWLSRETGRDFRRVACVELMDYAQLQNRKQGEAQLIVSKAFSTLHYLIEQAALRDIPVGVIAMPLIGSGCQQIEPEYIMGPMITHCRRLIEHEEGVRQIVIYEKNPEKAKTMIAAFEEAFCPAKDTPQVFISYCSKQAEEAQQIFDFLTEKRIRCWMAPLSIPAGSSYLDQIPIAISRIQIMLVLLTPEAEGSRWVQKEIGSAIGANKTVLPYMPREYKVGDSFMFLLDGEQILPGYLLCRENLDRLYERICELRR